MITKDGKDLPIGELTAQNYLCPKGEEGTYHVLQELVRFDPMTGKRLSKPCIQKYGRKMWTSMIYDNLLKQGYQLTILHDPTEYEEANREKMEKAAKARAEAKAKAEKEKFDAAVAEAVAKALAAQKPKKSTTKSVKSSIA